MPKAATKPAARTKTASTPGRKPAASAVTKAKRGTKAPRAMAGNKPGSTTRKIAPAIVEKRSRSKALSAAGTKKRA